MTTHGTSDQPPGPGEDKLVEENRAYWREVGRSLVKGSIDAADEVAKQIITVAGVLEGLYFHAIAFGDLTDTAKYPAYLLQLNLGVYLIPIGLLLVSLALALLVFFPARYRINLQAHEAARLVFTRIATRKLWLVRLSAVFLVLGVLAVGNAAYVYLAYR